MTPHDGLRHHVRVHHEPSLTTFSPADDAHSGDLADWVAVTAAADQGLWGDSATTRGADELRSAARKRDEHNVMFLLRASNGSPVAAGGLRHRFVDEPTFVRLTLAVHPQHQRQGHATRVHAAMEAHALARGARQLAVTADIPADQDGRPTTGAIAAALASLGYQGTLPHLRNDLALPMDPELERRARAVADAGMRADYRVETCAGTPPEEWFADLAHLRVRMSTDTPSGVAHDAEQWDADRVRDLAENRATSGRLYVTAVARHLPSGRLVGYSDISDSSADTANGYQQDTLVLREHRGHRLGMALKLAATSTMAQARPSLRVIHTWNATSNAPMLAVNRAVGFRTVGVGDEWVKELTGRPVP